MTAIGKFWTGWISLLDNAIIYWVYYEYLTLNFQQLYKLKVVYINIFLKPLVLGQCLFRSFCTLRNVLLIIFLQSFLYQKKRAVTRQILKTLYKRITKFENAMLPETPKHELMRNYSPTLFESPLGSIGTHGTSLLLYNEHRKIPTQ